MVWKQNEAVSVRSTQYFSSIRRCVKVLNPSGLSAELFTSFSYTPTLNIIFESNKQWRRSISSAKQNYHRLLNTTTCRCILSFHISFDVFRVDDTKCNQIADTFHAAVMHVCIMRVHVPAHRRMQIQYISLARIKYVPGNRRFSFARSGSFTVLYGCVIAKRRHVKFLYDGMNRGLKTAQISIKTNVI